MQTEQDFAQIAGAGLNHVRIPLPYWAIEVWNGEPFLPKTAWTCVSRSTSLFLSHSPLGTSSKRLNGRGSTVFALI